VRLVRASTGGDAHRVGWDPAAGRIDAAGLAGVDAIVNLAGEPIGTKRWTAAQKERILGSRERGTALLARTAAELEPKPAVFVSGSAIGYYGDRGDEVLTEESASGDGFLADVVRRWEASTAPAAQAGIRVARIRTGLVLGAGGGLLKRMLLPFRLGFGARLSSGKQWMSWISLADEVGAIVYLLEGDGAGAFNLTAPLPVTNAAFTASLARALGRPGRLVVPRAAVSAVFGGELADDLLGSQRVLPMRLETAGYLFKHLDLDEALASLFAPPK
jgi:uncharacterized protein (TIGR01777 family)